MPNFEEKQKVVEDIKQKFEGASGVILADYRGLTVSQVTNLRVELRQAGIEYRVLKNTMVRRAADEIGITGLDEFLEGPTALAFSTDPVAPAKILSEFSKKNKSLTIKAGVLDGKVIDADKVKDLANLPSREVLLSQVLAGMQGPLQGMVNVLQGPIRKFGYALEEVRKLKEAQA
ncbi:MULTISPECIES: 50S ribosomal protein L10 [unclassified Dehalobacter]|jgi:large subunit ribosomal protein L10|uniref:50S ribosomal protein L10 n=1 Tax=unclassified Dehalobacter TaxID=2635733 RepID=UPI000363A3FC|nr:MULTISPECIES: 50S ribosomal protein L10 [unclassified Dehalobacter]RJE48114.1 50S ribosomal protein L10 [Dehalobacter sp. MCB1]TCX49586.1 50S ribosomal protein L10 [Dehalobacter sp. 14DCB1]TCX50290.1 50S ribosomal protein L10 [Dehalobacter sp. 12DCB1]